MATTLAPAVLSSTFAPIYYIGGLNISYVSNLDGTIDIYEDLAEAYADGTIFGNVPVGTITYDENYSVQEQVEAFAKDNGFYYMPTVTEVKEFGFDYDPRKAA